MATCFGRSSRRWRNRRMAAVSDGVDERPTLLILEDKSRIRSELEALAEELGYNWASAASPEEATRCRQRCDADVFVVDLQMSGEHVSSGTTHRSGGYQWLLQRPFRRNQTVIIYSVFYDSGDVSVPAGIGTSVLGLAKTATHAELREELRRRANYLYRRRAAHVWKSEISKRLLEVAHLVAPTKMPVLIIGPSGSGKEETAREIHRKSGRGTLEIVNCGAFSPSLLMAQLFGHTKGAFTDARQPSLGLLMKCGGYDPHVFEWDRRRMESEGLTRERDGSQAWWRRPREDPGGTLVLDEVAELPPEAQAALLRVLDGAPVLPIGDYAGDPFKVDVRVIAMTNDIRKLSDESKFRRDLLHRLSGWVLETKPISERPEDAKELVIQRVREMAVEVGAVAEYPWRGLGDEDVLSEDAWQRIEEELDAIDGGARGLIWVAKRAAVWAWVEA
ncbi:MAG: sigma 54-interacting transcriptional regulator, partial [Myxococcales bacterium]|nr:sigma 54-interacting transcriptional regulator [Myxococcales bacterium]